MVELCFKLKPDSFPDVQHFPTTSDNILWMKIFYLIIVFFLDLSSLECESTKIGHNY